MAVLAVTVHQQDKRLFKTKTVYLNLLRLSEVSDCGVSSGQARRAVLDLTKPEIDLLGRYQSVSDIPAYIWSQSNILYHRGSDIALIL